jgi:hypothetical protein
MASLGRIGAGSAQWRAEIGAVRRTGVHALVLTADQVMIADPHAAVPQAFDPSVLGEVSLVLGEGSRVDLVLVVVNLALLDEIHARRSSVPAERDADLDRILVHEVYGHAFPYLAAGDTSGRCADPEPGQRPTDACAIRRENVVRAELGLGRRLDHGLKGLGLGRPAASVLNRLEVTLSGRP